MSLPNFSTQAELFSTAGISGNLFGDKDRYRLFALKVYPALAQIRPQLETCYCADNGRAAVEPVLLLGVSLLQFLEGVPDRQAIDLLRYHAGWNFALNRQVGDDLFHSTTLVNFRQRLCDNDLSCIGFETIMNCLVQAGLVSKQSRQRLDSTQMFGRVSRMSKLDCVRQTIRLALEEMEKKLPAQQRPAWWALLWDRYVDSQTDYRASQETLTRKYIEAGMDAQSVLHWLATAQADGLSKGTQAQLLNRVFFEQFEIVDGSDSPKIKTKEELSSNRVQNPHDPDATYGAKGKGDKKKEHVGYKVQVAETVTEKELAPGEPTSNFISSIVTHAAYQSDEEGHSKVQLEQQDMGFDKAPVLYVDAAYVSAKNLAEAATEGREIIGPALPAASNNGGHFTSEQFNVIVEDRKAICPSGQQSSQCSRLEEKATGKVSYRFEWNNDICGSCPLKNQCFKDTLSHRSLVVGEHHTILQARRQEQKTEPFKLRMHHRNAIEGTQSELVRAHGMRRARYCGLAKTKLQNYFIGAACNIKRWFRRIVWDQKNCVDDAIVAAAVS